MSRLQGRSVLGDMQPWGKVLLTALHFAPIAGRVRISILDWQPLLSTSSTIHGCLYEASFLVRSCFSLALTAIIIMVAATKSTVIKMKTLTNLALMLFTISNHLCRSSAGFFSSNITTRDCCAIPVIAVTIPRTKKNETLLKSTNLLVPV